MEFDGLDLFSLVMIIGLLFLVVADNNAKKEIKRLQKRRTEHQRKTRHC